MLISTLRKNRCAHNCLRSAVRKTNESQNSHLRRGEDRAENKTAKFTVHASKKGGEEKEVGFTVCII